MKKKQFEEKDGKKKVEHISSQKKIMSRSCNSSLQRFLSKNYNWKIRK